MDNFEKSTQNHKSQKIAKIMKNHHLKYFFKIIHLFIKMSLKNGRHGFRNLRCCTFEWWYFSQHMLTFWSTNPPWSVVKIWENGDFGHISCCTTGNIGQHVLTKVVLTKSMMHQLSKTVSNVSQLFLDHFITFCKETTYFQAKIVLKIGRCQLFR